MKNVLYCTHRLDKIDEKLDRLLIDKHLQFEVDDFYKKQGSRDPED